MPWSMLMTAAQLAAPLLDAQSLVPGDLERRLWNPPSGGWKALMPMTPQEFEANIPVADIHDESPAPSGMVQKVEGGFEVTLDDDEPLARARLWRSLPERLRRLRCDDQGGSADGCDNGVCADGSPCAKIVHVPMELLDADSDFLVETFVARKGFIAFRRPAPPFDPSEEQGSVRYGRLGSEQAKTKAAAFEACEGCLFRLEASSAAAKYKEWWAYINDPHRGSKSKSTSWVDELGIHPKAGRLEWVMARAAKLAGLNYVSFSQGRRMGVVGVFEEDWKTTGFPQWVLNEQKSLATEAGLAWAGPFEGEVPPKGTLAFTTYARDLVEYGWCAGFARVYLGLRATGTYKTPKDVKTDKEVIFALDHHRDLVARALVAQSAATDGETDDAVLRALGLEARLDDQHKAKQLVIELQETDRKRWLPVLQGLLGSDEDDERAGAYNLIRWVSKKSGRYFLVSMHPFRHALAIAHSEDGVLSLFDPNGGVVWGKLGIGNRVKSRFRNFLYYYFVRPSQPFHPPPSPTPTHLLLQPTGISALSSRSGGLRSMSLSLSTWHTKMTRAYHDAASRSWCTKPVPSGCLKSCGCGARAKRTTTSV